MNKLISIIVPCYNVESYIDRCFRSIAAQTIGIENLEVILVDDCSTDATWEKLTVIEAAYPDSVIIIHCEENGRQGKARNIGMEYASAPFIGFIDADDWIEPDMYEKLLMKIITHHCDIVMCRTWRDHDSPDQELAPKLTGQAERFFSINTIERRKVFLVCFTMGASPCDKLFSHEFLKQNHIFFPEHLAYEDHFFATLLYLYVSRVYILEERLYHYYVNPHSSVLTPDAAHHFHILEADTMLWEECRKRGFLELYPKEIEYTFLTLFYLISLKTISLRFSKAPYDFFLKVKEETLKRVPNYHDNPYVKDYVTQLNQALLQLLDYPVSEEDLNAVCRSLRKKYNMEGDS